MKIAVIGSGIAGLSAAWLLGRAHKVTLFEKSQRLGMDAHGIDIECSNENVRIDVPLRVFFDGFYPNLTALYKALGIKSEPINYSASFGLLDDRTYFRYDNYKLGPYALPFLKGPRAVNLSAVRIGWEIMRLFRRLPKSLAAGIADDLTLAAYLEQQKFSKKFAEGFLYPAFCGICTCSLERIKNYPARTILEYLNSQLLFSSVRRVTQGTQQVVQQLAKNVHEIHLNTSVVQVTSTKAGAVVMTPKATMAFDHVVLATQANQSKKLLEDTAVDEREILSAFSYEYSRVVVHRDTRLAPPGNQGQWAPVNFLLKDLRRAPMATIWMNAIQDLPDQDHLFQTWNPIIDPDPKLVLAESEFERPLVSAESLNALKHLEHLHSQPDRRIWFCGSYAAHGIPLLESATHSAMSVAERLGSRRPWP